MKNDESVKHFDEKILEIYTVYEYVDSFDWFRVTILINDTYVEN